MEIQKYIEEVKSIDRTMVKELGYRTPLENLLNSIKLKSKNISVLHEESNKDVDGIPDFSIYEDMTTLFKKLVGYIECKKLDYNLDKLINSNQIKKYAKTSDNIIITNYREFILLQKRKNTSELEEIKRIKILTDDLSISPHIETEIQDFENLILDFFKYEYQSIKTKKQLIEVLSKQSFYLSQKLREKIEHPKENQHFYKVINRLFKNYSQTLHYTYSKADFCDIYSQSLVYGLFISRLEDPKLIFDEIKNNYVNYIPENFTLLKEFLQEGISSYTPKGIEEVYKAVARNINLINIESIEKEFSKIDNGRNNIVVHLYEDFLSAYDKLKATENRKESGVYYTPIEAVNFITRSVNEVIKDKLGKAKGFNDENVKILDFATGTGTFLSSIIEQMIPEDLDSLLKKEVKEKILNNVYGFELLFTPYLVAHIVLTKKLEEKGIKLNNGERLGVFLTNTLDLESNTQPSNLIFLDEEADKVHKIKKEEDILAIVGNPPYFNGASSNNSKHIIEILKDYKKGLNEKKINLDDLYIQFIRFAEDKISKTENGVVGIITNNSFIDGITHRQMRKHLLETFDEVYILNLHGNTRKGENDKNIFDIMVGVNISIFIKNPNLKEKAIYYYSTKENDLISRKSKLEFLDTNSLKTIKWDKLDIDEKNCWFAKKDLSFQSEYDSFWKITDIFKEYVSGLETNKDKFCIKYNQKILEKQREDIKNLSVDEISKKYEVKNSRDWSIEKAKRDLIDGYNPQKTFYRVYDNKFTSLSKKSRGFICNPRYNVMQHFDNKDNLGICFERGFTKHFNHIFISNKTSDCHYLGAKTYTSPLYLYNRYEEELDNTKETKEVNFTEMFKGFIEGLSFKPSPEDIMAYIYGVMHSLTYRAKYIEFLKIDFPAIPFLKDKDIFYTYAKSGQKLIDLHLLKSDLTDKEIKVNFDDKLKDFIIEKIEAPKVDKSELILKTIDGKVISVKGLSKKIYDFEIGSYKPIDKWIKYRIKDKVELGLGDLKHIKDMVISIKKTIEIMGEIDKVGELYLGNKTSLQKNVIYEESIIDKGFELYEKNGWVNPELIANDLGINIYKDNNVKKAQIRYNKDKDIYEIVSADPSDNFLTMHELCHLPYHEADIRKYGAVGRKDDFSKHKSEENKASILAEKVLMPDYYVEQFMNEELDVRQGGFISNRKIVQDFADNFRVSYSVAKIRLIHLGYRLSNNL